LRGWQDDRRPAIPVHISSVRLRALAVTSAAVPTIDRVSILGQNENYF